MSVAETNSSQTEAIQLTENAAHYVKELMAKEENPEGKRLRVYVETGGCSGLQYGMVFDEPRPDDLLAEFHGVGIAVDAFSAKYLEGAVVDYVDELTGGGFKIFNPRARESCGCGKSFQA